MAYLDTQLSKQEMGIVADNIPIDTEEPASSVSVATDCAENSNFQIARLLKGEKSRLIKALSQFPVTALWCSMCMNKMLIRMSRMMKQRWNLI